MKTRFFLGDVFGALFVKNLSFKSAAFIFSVIFALSASSLAAQDEEMSIEDYWLKESPEMMVIRERAQSGDRATKLDALDDIDDAIKSGKKTDAMREILTGLALEGILNKTLVEGRVSNNFSDVRKRAVEYLGELGTKEASEVLVRVALIEEEPMVISEAFRALQKSAQLENGRALDTVNWIFQRFNAVNPDNSLAFDYLLAVEYFLPNLEHNNQREKTRIRDDTIMKVGTITSNGKYTTRVRNKARDVMKKLSKVS